MIKIIKSNDIIVQTLLKINLKKYENGSKVIVRGRSSQYNIQKAQAIESGSMKKTKKTSNNK